MKKLLASLLLSASIMSQAQAGFGIAVAATATNMIAEARGKDLQYITVPYVAAGVGIMFVSGVIVAATNMGNVYAPWGFFFFLDANGNLPQENISLALKNKYPFLDNETVIKNLSQAMKDKYQKTKVDLVSLEQNEVEAILAPADLSTEQLNIITNDLI